MDVARSYSRMSAQLVWLLGQRGITERAIAEAIRAVVVGEPAGLDFPAGSHENIILRLACVWTIRAPWLSPQYLARTPLELGAVVEGQTTLASCFDRFAELEARTSPQSPVSTRVRVLVQDIPLDIETLWSAEGAVLIPLLRQFRERVQSPEGAAVLDAASDELTKVVTEALPAQERALSDDERRFLANAAEAGGAFDAGVVSGVITSTLLAQYLAHVFVAISSRQQIPELGPEHLKAPLQWLCDLFVDAVNADPSTVAGCEEYLVAIEKGESTAAHLTTELARRIFAAKGLPSALQ